jgi:hypothetical protein
MKKIVLGFLLSVLVSSFLYAKDEKRHVFSYSANRVLYVEHIAGNKKEGYNYEAEQVSYKPQYYPVPIPNSRYGYTNPAGGIWLGETTTVWYEPYVATTSRKYTPNLVWGLYQYYVYIYVYIKKNSNEYVQIWERNRAEERAGLNDRVVKGDFSEGPNYMDVYHTYANGDKIVKYKIPDLSNSTKVVRVATCPKWKKTTEVYCTQTIAVIKGTAGD